MTFAMSALFMIIFRICQRKREAFMEDRVNGNPGSSILRNRRKTVAYESGYETKNNLI